MFEHSSLFGLSVTATVCIVHCNVSLSPLSVVFISFRGFSLQLGWGERPLVGRLRWHRDGGDPVVGVSHKTKPT